VCIGHNRREEEGGQGSKGQQREGERVRKEKAGGLWKGKEGRCVRCHVRTTASETEALELPVREFGMICLVACEHLTSVTNISKRY